MDDMQRAHRARRLLDDPVLQEIAERLETRYVQEWQDTEDERQHLLAWARMRALRDVFADLNRAASELEMHPDDGDEDDLPL